MSTLADRLVTLRGLRSRKEFSELIGVKETTLRNYEQGTTLPTSDVLVSVCKKLQISPSWLLLGENDKELPSEKEQQEPSRTPSTLEDDLVMIPMVKAVLSAGSGSLETNGDCEREYAFRRDFISRKGHVKDMVLMRVHGDSMEPEICHNDVVLLDQSKRTILPGHIFAVGFEEAIYLKRIDVIPGKAILKSANPAYPQMELDIRGQLSEQFRVIGRVLWSGREYK